MNCKPGDLVVQVKSVCGNEGQIFTCLRLASTFELLVNDFNSSRGPVWWIDRKIKLNFGASAALTIDAWIRPIRDTPGEDETLQWALVPGEKVTA